MKRAVVCAYHNVGVRCLSVLLAHGVDIPLVLTHEDSPQETIWFDSVARLANEHGIRCETPLSLDSPDWHARLAELDADFLFSFYYRNMLSPAVLELFPGGAFNMHGSLLPAYRGRVPVNWAVIRGEARTGATLHAMVAKPDAGAIVDQMAIPILPDDTAGDVFNKVTVAAEMVLDRALPALLAGCAVLTPQDLVLGSYFGGRRPEDGRIDWNKTARDIHNLVRGVAPPYPGAFCELGTMTLKVLRTLPSRQGLDCPGPALWVEAGQVFASAGDGGILRILSATLDGNPLTAESFVPLLSAPRIAL